MPGFLVQCRRTTRPPPHQRVATGAGRQAMVLALQASWNRCALCLHAQAVEHSEHLLC